MVQCCFRRWRSRRLVEARKQERRVAFAAEVEMSLKIAAALAIQAVQRRRIAAKRAAAVAEESGKAAPTGLLLGGGKTTGGFRSTSVTHSSGHGTPLQNVPSLGGIPSSLSGLFPSISISVRSGPSPPAGSPANRAVGLSSSSSGSTHPCVLVVRSGNKPSQQAAEEADAILYLQPDGTAEVVVDDDSDTDYYFFANCHLHKESSVTRAFAMQSIRIGSRAASRMSPGAGTSSFAGAGMALSHRGSAVISPPLSQPPPASSSGAVVGGSSIASPHTTPPLTTPQSHTASLATTSAAGKGQHAQRSPQTHRGAAVSHFALANAAAPHWVGGTVLHECAAEVIQTFWRRYAARKRLRELTQRRSVEFKHECQSTLLQVSAELIQSVFRGHRARAAAMRRSMADIVPPPVVHQRHAHGGGGTHHQATARGKDADGDSTTTSTATGLTLKAAIALQRFVRRALAKKRVAQMKCDAKRAFAEECNNSLLLLAVLTIQTNFRMWKARRTYQARRQPCARAPAQTVAATAASPPSTTTSVNGSSTRVHATAHHGHNHNGIPMSLRSSVEQAAGDQGSNSAWSRPAKPTGVLSPSAAHFVQRRRMIMSSSADELPRFTGDGVGLAAVFAGSMSALLDRRTLDRSLLWGIRLLHTVCMELAEASEGRAGVDAPRAWLPRLPVTKWVQGSLSASLVGVAPLPSSGGLSSNLPSRQPSYHEHSGGSPHSPSGRPSGGSLGAHDLALALQRSPRPAGHLAPVLVARSSMPPANVALQPSHTEPGFGGPSPRGQTPQAPGVGILGALHHSPRGNLSTPPPASLRPTGGAPLSGVAHLAPLHPPPATVAWPSPHQNASRSPPELNALRSRPP